MILARSIRLVRSFIGNARSLRRMQPKVTVSVTIGDVPQFVFFNQSEESA